MRYNNDSCIVYYIPVAQMTCICKEALVSLQVYHVYRHVGSVLMRIIGFMSSSVEDEDDASIEVTGRIPSLDMSRCPDIECPDEDI